MSLSKEEAHQVHVYWEGCSYLCIFSLSLSLTFNPVSHHSVFPSQKQLHAYSLSLLPTTELSPLHSLTFEQQRNMQLSLKINQLWFHPLFFLILTISCFLWVHYKTHISGSDLVLLTFWCGAREGQRTGSFTLIGKPVKFACEVLWGCPTLFLFKWKLTVNPSLVYTFTASPTRSCCCPGYGRGNAAPVGPELEQGGAPAGRVSWGVGERTWTIS